MQDISLCWYEQEVNQAPVEQSIAEMRESRWFHARTMRSAASPFLEPEYVGAVLTASFSPAALIQSIETEGVRLVPSGLPQRFVGKEWLQKGNTRAWGRCVENISAVTMPPYPARGGLSALLLTAPLERNTDFERFPAWRTFASYLTDLTPLLHPGRPQWGSGE